MEARLRESLERPREISRRMVRALEAERRSISRELHDGIGGNLAALRLMLEEARALAAQSPPVAAALENAIAFLSRTIKESKRIAAMMRPLTMDGLGTVTTLQGFVKQFAGQFKDIVICSRIDIRDDEAADEQKIMLYRVLQEGLTNVGKHARPTAVCIELRTVDATLALEIRDNGVGFDPRAVLERDGPSSGLGLKSLRERVEVCRGTFRLESEPGRGTCLRVALPAEAARGEHRDRATAPSGNGNQI